MPLSNQELANRFAAGKRRGSSNRMYIEGDTIYSYGSHFPIAHRTKKGYTFNRSKYSHSTSKHQGAVRRALQAADARIFYREVL